MEKEKSNVGGKQEGGEEEEVKRKENITFIHIY